MTATASRWKWLYTAAAFGLAAALLYFSLRGLDWHQVRAAVGQARPWYVGAWCLLGIASLFLRAIRWRVVLQANAVVDVSTVFWATCAGYFGNSFLPARAGELVRTMMISRLTGLSNAYVLTTALSERITDAIALVLISSAILLTLPAPPGFATASRVFAIIGLCGALGLAFTPMLDPLWRRILGHLPLPVKIVERLNRVLDQVLLGIRSFHDPGRLGRFIGLTAIIWLVDPLATVLGAYALNMTMSLPAAFLLIAGLGLGSALPSTPGYVGVYQFVAVTVLMPFGFTRVDAIAFILFAQALQYMILTVFGLIALWKYRRLAGSERLLAEVDSAS